MVPISRSTNGCESGTYGTVLMSCTSSIRRFACHWQNRYRGSWSELRYVGSVCDRVALLSSPIGPSSVGHMEALGFQFQQEAVLKTLTEDVVKSSEIEGEKLDVNQVRSSVARRLGMDVGGLKAADRHVEGVPVSARPTDETVADLEYIPREPLRQPGVRVEASVLPCRPIPPSR